MTVECPRCGTRYRTPASGAAPERYRCSRCRFVFRSEPEGEEDVPLVLAGRGDDAAADDDDAFTIGDEDEEEEPMPVTTAARAPRREPSPPTRTAARFAFRALLLVLAAYALLSVYLYTHPRAIEDLLGRVPLIGAELALPRLSPGSVQLANVEGTYQRVQGDHLVFVVTGIAINNAPVAVGAVQVEARVSGTQEQRQVVYAGTVPNDLQALSVREIALLQTLEPPKDAQLAPGAQAPFAAVFVNPAPDLREFAAEVVAVQGAPRRRGAPADRRG
jgi:predicted Zn finger-like uncharacterized protein